MVDASVIRFQPAQQAGQPCYAMFAYRRGSVENANMVETLEIASQFVRVSVEPFDELSDFPSS